MSSLCPVCSLLYPPTKQERVCSSKAVSSPTLTARVFSNCSSLHETPPYLGIITELLPNWAVGGFGELMPGKLPACLYCTTDTSFHCFFLGTTHPTSGCFPSQLPFPALRQTLHVVRQVWLASGNCPLQANQPGVSSTFHPVWRIPTSFHPTRDNASPLPTRQPCLPSPGSTVNHDEKGQRVHVYSQSSKQPPLRTPRKLFPTPSSSRPFQLM